ncbi:hypothetical protein EV363DRAFT_1443953 [Boletus edulis]|nr:hypothetical protein EV363DRAFT_1443953 [Boletus edulis]
MVHRNFEQTEEMVNNLNLLEMNSKLDVLEEMLAADSQELVGPAPNLLHVQTNRLETFRNQTLTRIFERLFQLIVDFEAYLTELAWNILPLVRAGYPKVVVKLIRVREERGRKSASNGFSMRPPTNMAYH